MGKIKLLSPELINLIAAGEVVERPASVVKELIENSIDAGADRVIINIEEGGRKKIEVIDNGSGMDEEDARLALTQHATSKLATKDDLSNIHTLGFRGEALASISSVSTIEIDTKYRGSEAVKLLADKDGIKKKSSSRSDVGTTITVKDLFQSTPARLKFLRSQETEFGHIQDLVNSLGLANLNVHLELYHNSKLVLRLPKAKDMSERVFSIWNRNIAENLYIQEVEKPGYKLFIAAGKPDIGRKDRKLQYLFVNKRLITDRLLQKAILESYKGYLHRDLYPVYFIFLEIDPKLVDVNVHPRKQEVRFNNTQEVYSFVFNGLRTLIDQSTKDDLVSRIKEGRNEEGPFRSSSNGNLIPAGLERLKE
jgi:DNA mismatch repair protein MutL